MRLNPYKIANCIKNCKNKCLNIKQGLLCSKVLSCVDFCPCWGIE